MILLYRLRRVIILLIACAFAFQAGREHERDVYEDRCLDLGGGRNPAGYPICVIEGAG